MKVGYLIRLDDASPYMDSGKWKNVEGILDKYGVKPLVGIIPANADSKTMIEPEDEEFWNKAQRWQNKGWSLALHGYDHVCISDEGLKGLNPVWKRSEFAGVSLDVQKKKVRKGVAILKGHGINPKYFFAPSHTFDNFTLDALKKESDIRIISDSYTLMPYRKDGFVFIPCQIGSPNRMRIPGIYTICLHPNSMDENQFLKFESFIKDNQQKILKFSDIDTSHVGDIRFIDSIVQLVYFIIRRWRNMRK